MPNGTDAPLALDHDTAFADERQRLARMRNQTKERLPKGIID